MTPWLYSALGLGAAFVISYLFVRHSDRSTKHKLSELTEGRDSLADDAFYDRFFAESGIPRDVVARVRAIFQQIIPADLSALEADDDLSGDFRVIWMLDSMADVEIVVELEKAFGITIQDSEAETATSFRKVVDLVWSKLQAARE